MSETNATTDQPNAPDATQALRAVTNEIEAGAARLGWDKPPSIYALVQTQALLETPDLPADVEADLREAWDGTTTHLSAILQDSISDDVEDVLPKLAWPETVTGAALTLERLVAPPEVEAQAPEDPDEAAEFISNHPLSAEVRLTVGATRNGDSWCAIRTRDFDDPAHVVAGENLVPLLVEGLQNSLLPDTASEE